MLSKGNGEPNICALNILLTHVGECCYTRNMGLDCEIDAIYNAESPVVRANVDDQISTYEPRVNIKDISLGHDPAVGGLKVTAYLERKLNNG